MESMMSKKIKLAFFGFLGLMFAVYAPLEAYGRYGAVWHNKETKSTLRVIGDIHNGDEFNKIFCQNIQNALVSTKFRPFYIGETSHALVGMLKYHQNVDSEYWGMLKYLTLVHLWKKDIGQKGVLVINKQPNLFSKKDRVMPTDGNFQALSPLVGDLRVGLQDMDEVVKAGLVTEVSSESRLHQFFQSMSHKVNTRNYDNYYSFNDPYLKQLCSNAKIDFKIFTDRFLQTCQRQFKKNQAHSLVTKVFLENVGNNMLACEEILKKTRNYALLKALQDLYSVLQENLLIEKDSVMDLFIKGTLSSDFFNNELADKVNAFGKAMFLDLPDFGFLAKTIQVMPFVDNIVIYAGDAHIWGIEKYLKKAGYDCVWSKNNTDKTPLSQQDLETFFSVKTELSKRPSKKVLDGSMNFEFLDEHGQFIMRSRL